MARARQRLTEDSDMEDVSKKEAEAEAEDVANGSGEEDDEEYEIEKIIDVTAAGFPGGQMGYFVKWKNYPDSSNSWVAESDAGNAQELIDAFWAERGGREAMAKKSKPRKSDTKAKTSAVAKRKSPESITMDSDQEAVPKKRGRPPKASVSDDDQPVSKSTTAAKARKSTGASGSASARKSTARANDDDTDMDDDKEPTYVNMKKWKNAPSWDHLVDHIETVERAKDNSLKVYFVLNSKDGKEAGMCCEDSSICKKKMPQMLIDFYESNLRWRETE